MSKVFLITHHLLPKLRELVAKDVASRFKQGEKIAVKCHMGEYGNLGYVRPPIVELVVDELKKIGTEPFLFDTPAMYSGDRDTPEKYLDTARKNGFSQETMGCPIVITDNGRLMESKNFGQLEIASDLYEADGMVVVSHFKAHGLVTFGGAIKNIGMGAITKKGKTALHLENQPKVSEDCTGCSSCVTVCPFKAIELKEEKAVINYDSCFGCGACIDVCPVSALSVETAPMPVGLAEVCSNFLEKFGKRIFYINVLLDITDKCDCYPIGQDDMGKVVCPDIGISASDDLVAIDKASLDMVQEATENKFGQLTSTDPEKQINVAIEHGLGGAEYEMSELE